MSITKSQMRDFIAKRAAGVLSTVSPAGAPEAALVDLAVTPELELIFHTLSSTRKCTNLQRDPRVAVVIGWDGDQTLQYEGKVTEVGDHEVSEVKKFYLEACPQTASRSGWPGLIYFRVHPTWIRFSSYTPPWHIEDMTFPPRDKIHAKQIWNR